MNFSVIGTGYIMPRHVDAINAVNGKVLHFVNSTNAGDIERAVSDPRTDAVVILTPNDSHASLAKLAAHHRKLVLCEKPLGITSDSVKELLAFDNIFTVLQLRHHPDVIALKEAIAADSGPFDVAMNIAVVRDQAYFRSWKGDADRSGGTLFNIGIHYFDLLLQLFGEPDEIDTLILEPCQSIGRLGGKNWSCRWSVRVNPRPRKPISMERGRTLNINGWDVNLSSRDNLSEENLHRNVYRDLLEGRGVTPDEALKSVSLVERIYASPSRIQKA